MGVYTDVPAVHTGVTHVAGVHPVHHPVYTHPYYHMYGKREAEAEPYTMGQVYAGLPIANAIATGHPHNVGVITTMGLASMDKLSHVISAPVTDCLEIYQIQ